MTQQTDSTELERLRRLFHHFEYHKPEPRTATPFRLGWLAGERKILITDFGSHSKRWTRLFEEGRREADPTLKKVKG